MKKIALALLAALIIPTAALAAGKEIKVGVTPFPHKDIMNVVKQLVAKDGTVFIHDGLAGDQCGQSVFRRQLWRGGGFFLGAGHGAWVDGTLQF